MIVLRAGDVIPQVDLARPARRRARRTARAPPQPPERCPFCDTPTIKDAGVFTRCPNRECPERRWQLLTTFAHVMDIDGLGEKQVATFQRLGLVRTVGRLLPAEPEKLLELDGYGAGERRTACSRSIEASRERPFGIVLFAIGIEGVGYVTGRSLAAALPHHRRAAGRHAGADRRDAGHRADRGGADPLASSTSCGR